MGTCLGRALICCLPRPGSACHQFALCALYAAVVLASLVSGVVVGTFAVGNDIWVESGTSFKFWLAFMAAGFLPCAFLVLAILTAVDGRPLEHTSLRGLMGACGTFTTFFAMALLAHPLAVAYLGDGQFEPLDGSTLGSVFQASRQEDVPFAIAFQFAVGRVETSSRFCADLPLYKWGCQVGNDGMTSCYSVDLGRVCPVVDVGRTLADLDADDGNCFGTSSFVKAWMAHSELRTDWSCGDGTGADEPSSLRCADLMWPRQLPCVAQGELASDGHPLLLFPQDSAVELSWQSARLGLVGLAIALGVPLAYTVYVNCSPRAWYKRCARCCTCPSKEEHGGGGASAAATTPRVVAHAGDQPGMNSRPPMTTTAEMPGCLTTLSVPHGADAGLRPSLSAADALRDSVDAAAAGGVSTRTGESDVLASDDEQAADDTAAAGDGGGSARTGESDLLASDDDGGEQAAGPTSEGEAASTSPPVPEGDSGGDEAVVPSPNHSFYTTAVVLTAVIKIQSQTRGYLARRQFRQLRRHWSAVGRGQKEGIPAASDNS